MLCISKLCHLCNGAFPFFDEHYVIVDANSTLSSEVSSIFIKPNKGERQC